MGVGGQRHAPAALPPGKTRYPLYRRMGGHDGQSGQMREISPPPGFDPRTIQSVARRYTDWDIPAHAGVLGSFKIPDLWICIAHRTLRSLVFDKANKQQTIYPIM